MRRRDLFLVVLMTFAGHIVSGQDSIVGVNEAHRHNTNTKFLLAGSTIIVGTVPLLIDIHDTDFESFHFYNDNKGYLQADKFVHSYWSYVATSLWYNELLKSGMDKRRALIIGGSIGMAILTPKELYDSFDSNGGFSWGDMLANLSGPVAFGAQEIIFHEQIIKIKYSFSRSIYADQANGYLGDTFLESYFKDFNGHTYWVNVNPAKVFPETVFLPDWLSISAGYSANGMFGKYHNIPSYRDVQIPVTERYRQFLFSLDVDWSEINVRSRFLRAVLNGINFIKIPFPTLEINSKGQIKGYWIYF